MATWQTYFQPSDLAEALALLAEHHERARIVAGATDVLVERLRGLPQQAVVLDLTRVAGLRYVREQGGLIRIGALATHNDVIASSACVEKALPLAQACWEVGAPQIRTRATIAGNVVTASPANDTITPLLALDAGLVLASAAGERVVPLREFYTGFRRSQIQPGELLREIQFAPLGKHQRGLFLKLGLRRAQAISVLNLAVVISFDGDIVAGARVALGCLAPTVVRAPAVEQFLLGKPLDEAVCVEAGRLALGNVAPIDDVRGTAAYRRAALANLLADALRRLAAGRERDTWHPQPVLLDSGERAPACSSQAALTEVATTINGVAYQLAGVQHKTLLDTLREDAGLTGTKSGCAEGECGACTVWLNGQAVMACLTPAAQAHGGSVTTIEGLARTENREQRTENREQRATEPQNRRTAEPETAESQNRGGRNPIARRFSAGNAQPVEPQNPLAQRFSAGADNEPLHPLQQAFIDCGAVQCGFCIPGMLMAGAKLLDEQAQPSLAQIQTALSGNICRCTGYKKIFDAVQAASNATE